MPEAGDRQGDLMSRHAERSSNSQDHVVSRGGVTPESASGSGSSATSTSTRSASGMAASHPRSGGSTAPTSGVAPPSTARPVHTSHASTPSDHRAAAAEEEGSHHPVAALVELAVDDVALDDVPDSDHRSAPAARSRCRARM